MKISPHSTRVALYFHQIPHRSFTERFRARHRSVFCQVQRQIPALFFDSSFTATLSAQKQTS